ncbi:uracil phosphoribosyltransferase [Candidatus Poriferisodalis sp.]|uniref:uracil phosphoribosyltransferase n=1 Tax=Candidatus Poriferisodalis sp. TaxID=3101277 RepID=UPI003B01342C
MNVNSTSVSVVAHPAAAALLTRLRDKQTATEEFRQRLSALTLLLVAEALRDATTVPDPVETPLGRAEGLRLEPLPAIVPVLRAGLGMLDATLRLVPGAPVGFIGMRRIEASGGSGHNGISHECYLESLPGVMEGAPVLLMDPMLATGGSAQAAIRVLRAAGVGPITMVCVLAAPEGVASMQRTAPDVRIVTAAVDSRLDERAFIVPGLGDAGDRLYGSA